VGAGPVSAAGVAGDARARGRVPAGHGADVVRWAAAGAIILAGAGLACAPDRPRLTAFNAAALGPPFRSALVAFAGDSIDVVQENAPSLEVVRKLTELGQVPDLLGVADDALLDDLVLPAHADWYVRFGTNALVLAYGSRALHADEINADNWWRILQRPGVRVGRSDMRVDPSGYRADMAMQLAEIFYGEPGLTARLRATIPPRQVRRAEADLSAHLQAGELDYGWTYESLARAHGLQYVKLPPALDLSAPALASFYAQAKVELPGTGGAPPIRLTGAPIVFALTVPRQAPRRTLAEAFVRFLLSPAGSDILRASGFTPLPSPEWVGEPPAGLRGVPAPVR